jgi:hypothetical protein
VGDGLISKRPSTGGVCLICDKPTDKGDEVLTIAVKVPIGILGMKVDVSIEAHEECAGDMAKDILQKIPKEIAREILQRLISLKTGGNR